MNSEQRRFVDSVKCSISMMTDEQLAEVRAALPPITAAVPVYELRADVPEHRAVLRGMLRAGRERRHPKWLAALEVAAREFEAWEATQ